MFKVPTFSTVLLIAAAVLLVLGMLLQLPASFSNVESGTGIQTLAGSRLYRGQAVWTTPDTGPAILDWRWCPSKGILSACVRGSSAGATLSATVVPGLNGIRVKEAMFFGVNVDEPTLTAGQPGLRLSGTLSGATLKWGDYCLYRVLPEATGDMNLDINGSRLRLQLEGEGSRAFKVSGDGIVGEFRINGNRLEGQMEIPRRYLPAENSFQQAETLKLPVLRKLPCRPRGR